MTILVTAANGNQGKLLLPKLAAAGIAVRAFVQSESSANALRAMGITEVVAGDISDPELLAKALKDINKVYHIGPTAHPKEKEIGFAMVDAAVAAGVQHFVFSSVLHAITTDLVQHAIKRDIEEHLLSSGLEFTILQPANYMLPLKLKSVFSDSVFKLSWSLDRRQSLVDLDDVTDVAVEVLANSARHGGATYELVGVGPYTAYELGGIMASALKRPIAVEEISADTYLQAWFGGKGPDEFPHQANVLRSITARYSSHDFIGNSNVLTWLLGRDPGTFEQFVRREFEAFQAGQRDPGGV